MKQETSYQYACQELPNKRELPSGGREGECVSTGVRGCCAFFVRSVIPALRAATNAGYSGRSAFTLIELLVVVLIIGILAAIAVPQYQKAVLKSRFSSLMPLAKALNDSEEAYYLEHGAYTNDKNKLDVTTTDTKAQITLGDAASHQYVKLTRGDIKNNVTMYQKHSPNFAGETHCEAEIDNTLANWLCQDSLKGTYIGTKYGYSIYSLNAEALGTLARNYYDLPNYSKVSDGDRCTADVGKCRYSSFDNGATCVGRSSGGCGYSKFTNSSGCLSCAGMSSYDENSYCVARYSGWNCDQSAFTNHSICYAVLGGCQRNTYDETSCCAGSKCPKVEDTCEYKGIEAPAEPAF